ncbi:2Fe-2S iron-sulfur cluster-binding protein [Marinicrinis sediminis]|uniref:2Fe-2S iron-sulfur cluster-binding protein n=1 Tax=Marinicrinis sediminis TaxID=1652465 RepID=A0ABW5RE65_9BACL
MVKVVFQDGDRRSSVEVKPGTNLLQAARKAKVPIKTRCEGNAACLMCKVKADDPSGLVQPNEKEKRKLDGAIEQGIRLACQAVVNGDAVVSLPEDPLKAAVRAKLEALKRKQEGEDLW